MVIYSLNPKKETGTGPYPDWSPTLSSIPQGTRVIAAISTSNFVSTPCTNVTNAFVMTDENSSCINKIIILRKGYLRLFRDCNGCCSIDMSPVQCKSNIVQGGQVMSCQKKTYISLVCNITWTSDISTESANWESIIFETFSANSPACISNELR